jgi:hypothetical protein
MQRAMRMRPIILPSVAYLALPYFSMHDFWKNIIEHKMCVLICSTTLSETFLILRRTERDIIKNVYWS